MKIGTPRDWSKEPKTVQKMFEFVIVNILDDFVTSDLQNLGITAEAADSGRIEVSGEQIAISVQILADHARSRTTSYVRACEL
jgi:hypothetical protein